MTAIYRTIGNTICLLMTASVVLATHQASAIGLMNIPSSFQQCMGYGMGPGYHAPLVLGSPCRARVATQPLIYQDHPPKPNHCANGFCGSMTALGGYIPPQPAPQPVYRPPTKPEYSCPPGQQVFMPPAPTPHVQPRPVSRRPAEPASPSDSPQPETIPLPRS